MLKPGLWPPNKPRSTESHAELAVYDALSKQLPRGWYAWHSLRIRVPGHPDAEADFIIADPAGGVLILEVKGGRIEERDGLWFSNGKLLKPAPREQAHRFLNELLQLLRSKDIRPPPCGIATCFPDTEFSSQPAQSDLAGTVIGAQDLHWLDQALPALMQTALVKGFRAKGPWLRTIHDLWGERWVPKMDFGLRARIEMEERLRLDDEQFAVLEGLLENVSVLVTGGAGTGKTVLALTLARKLAEAGKKVLMLCFTEALAHWLRSQVDLPNLAVWPIKRYAVELLRLAGREPAVEETAAFWNSVVPKAVLEVLSVDNPGWDAVVVDEVQDLNDYDWLMIEELSRNGIRWAFQDPEQSFWTDRHTPDQLFQTRYQLSKKYRCTAPVLQLAQCYLSGEPEASMPRGLDSESVAIRSCPGPGKVIESIANEINGFKRSGLAGSDIVVLSLRGAGEPGAIVHCDRIGTHQVVRADSPQAGSSVVTETFLRFKGLERSAVIITDVGLAIEKPDYRKRMYIALTRTLSAVRIIDTADSLARDPILFQR
jgi:ATP:corrinoid adenosyltransferase